MKHSAVNKIAGVTLIELLMVLVIVGILAGLAAPQFGGFMKQQALLAESKRITSLLKLARSEARARSAPVTLSRTAGSGWGNTIRLGEPATPLRTQEELIRTSESSGRVLAVDASFNGNTITFSPRGWVQSAFTIAICTSSTDSTNGRLIQVNRVGKINERSIGNESCTQ